MPNWKFWEKSPAMAESTREVSDPELRFGLQPRTDLPGAMQTTDPAKADQLFRLRKRRETILFDVDQSELAVAEENPWKERILHLDEAIEAVRLDYGTASTAHDTPGDPFEPIPIDRISVDEGPPPAVRFTVGDQPFLYQEDQDWAERGFQLARDE
jgi:hypothetical protein